MPTKEKLTIEQVIKALRMYDGMVYLTAKALRVTSKTIYNYIERHPEVAEAKKESEGEMLDLAERKLKTAIRKGSLQAIKFVLATKGKDRGYVERKEVTGPEGVPLTGDRVIRIVDVSDDDKSDGG